MSPLNQNLDILIGLRDANAPYKSTIVNYRPGRKLLGSSGGKYVFFFFLLRLYTYMKVILASTILNSSSYRVSNDSNEELVAR